MEINNQDIIRMTRQLRDEENQQLHVRRLGSVVAISVFPHGLSPYLLQPP